MEIEWSEDSIADMAKIDKANARRIKQSIERLAATGAGNVKKLEGIDPPEYRQRVGDYRVRFEHAKPHFPSFKNASHKNFTQ